MIPSGLSPAWNILTAAYGLEQWTAQLKKFGGGCGLAFQTAAAEGLVHSIIDVNNRICYSRSGEMTQLKQTRRLTTADSSRVSICITKRLVTAPRGRVKFILSPGLIIIHTLVVVCHAVWVCIRLPHLRPAPKGSCASLVASYIEISVVN